MDHKVQATWHLTGVNKQSCDYHKPELEAIKKAQDALDSKEYSEADHQTWLKL